jgi:hypothetical protein
MGITKYSTKEFIQPSMWVKATVFKVSNVENLDKSPTQRKFVERLLNDNEGSFISNPDFKGRLTFQANYPKREIYITAGDKEMANLLPGTQFKYLGKTYEVETKTLTFSTRECLTNDEIKEILTFLHNGGLRAAVVRNDQDYLSGTTFHLQNLPESLFTKEGKWARKLKLSGKKQPYIIYYGITSLNDIHPNASPTIHTTPSPSPFTVTDQNQSNTGNRHQSSTIATDQVQPSTVNRSPTPSRIITSIQSDFQLAKNTVRSKGDQREKVTTSNQYSCLTVYEDQDSGQLSIQMDTDDPNSKAKRRRSVTEKHPSTNPISTQEWDQFIAEARHKSLDIFACIDRQITRQAIRDPDLAYLLATHLAIQRIARSNPNITKEMYYGIMKKVETPIEFFNGLTQNVSLLQKENITKLALIDLCCQIYMRKIYESDIELTQILKSKGQVPQRINNDHLLTDRTLIDLAQHEGFRSSMETIAPNYVYNCIKDIGNDQALKKVATMLHHQC